MLKVEEEVTLADIDEALRHLREKIQDRYGNRVSAKQRQEFMTYIDDLLDVRLNLKVK